MMTGKDRIEAAAKYAYEQWSLNSWVVAWADIAPEHRKMWVDHATDLAGIIAPELIPKPVGDEPA